MPKIILRSSRFPAVANSKKQFLCNVPIQVTDSELEFLETQILPLLSDLSLEAIPSICYTPAEENQLETALQAIRYNGNPSALRSPYLSLPEHLREEFLSRLIVDEQVQRVIKVAAVDLSRDLIGLNGIGQAKIAALFNALNLPFC